MLKLAIFCAVLACVAAGPLYGGEGRIVNGTNAKPGEIPYIISLRNRGSHSCGGSILNEYFVLTAAHCIDRQSASSLSIQYGVLNIRNNNNVIQVTAIYKHESYSPANNYANDIAVLKLASAIQFGQNAQKTVLPAQGESPPGGQWGVLAGWGLEKTGGSVQGDLKRVDILVYTDADCSRAHGSRVDSRYHVCSGVPEGGKGQCSGDSGGPLYGNGKQVGVVSWSVKPCTIRGYPGVFARVSSYVDWIYAKLEL